MKTAIITGGNSGLGFETAKALLSKDVHTILACRNTQKGEAAKQKLESHYPGCKVEAMDLDLSSFTSIRNFGKRLQDSGQQIDILCNNAGIMACPEQRTEEGYEMQLAVNHLGHFLLTSVLMPLMASGKRPVRIVNVSSSAHLAGKINFEDLQCRKKYSRWAAYSQSKLANILFTYELAKRLPPHITANTLHPGIVNTSLIRHLVDLDPPWWKVPLQLPLSLSKLFIKTPENGAATQIHLCLSPEVEGVTGKYYADCKQTKSNAASYDEEAARKLWDVSMELTHATNFPIPSS